MLGLSVPLMFYRVPKKSMVLMGLRCFSIPGSPWCPLVPLTVYSVHSAPSAMWWLPWLCNESNLCRVNRSSIIVETILVQIHEK